MTFEEAYGFLKASEQYGSVLGLESMRMLLERLDNPHNRLKFVHVAGTNGKGSTAAYLANILAAAGFRVGRYISPSVFSYFEKIQISWSDKMINGKTAVNTDYIKEAEVSGYIERISKACASMTEDGLFHPTVFEIETAMAMLHFVNRNCDIVVLEVGLGGRLDATNVITTTVCSVITSISMDHMHILGNTLEEIAAEKAGIIKPGIPVVSYEQDEKATEVIKETCKSNNSVLTTADFNKILVNEQNISGTVFSYENLVNLKIKLLGENQVKNAVVAVLTIKTLQALGYTISEENIRNGLLYTRWRGRFEVVKDKPLFIIDGAHNEAAAISLAENIKIYFPHRRILFIMGVLADKDYDAVLKHTAPYADRIYTITPDNIRGLSSKVLAKAAEKYCRRVIDAGTVSDAVLQAYQVADEEDVLIAFGSLSYLEEVYALIAEGGNYGSEEN
jgi:dihydrofolate synthase/folylpolyglutamate synthase